MLTEIYEKDRDKALTKDANYLFYVKLYTNYKYGMFYLFNLEQLFSIAINIRNNNKEFMKLDNLIKKKIF